MVICFDEALGFGVVAAAAVLEGCTSPHVVDTDHYVCVIRLRTACVNHCISQGYNISLGVLFKVINGYVVTARRFRQVD